MYSAFDANGSLGRSLETYCTKEKQRRHMFSSDVALRYICQEETVHRRPRVHGIEQLILGKYGVSTLGVTGRNTGIDRELVMAVVRTEEAAAVSMSGEFTVVCGV